MTWNIDTPWKGLFLRTFVKKNQRRDDTSGIKCAKKKFSTSCHGRSWVHPPERISYEDGSGQGPSHYRDPFPKKVPLIMKARSSLETMQQLRRKKVGTKGAPPRKKNLAGGSSPPPFGDLPNFRRGGQKVHDGEKLLEKVHTQGTISPQGKLKPFVESF